MQASRDESSSEAATTHWWTVSQRYRDWGAILVVGFALLLVVPLLAGVPGAAGFAALNAVLGLVCIGGPKGWRAAFHGERDPLWPIQRHWVRIVPLGGLAALVLGALSLAGWG